MSMEGAAPSDIRSSCRGAYFRIFLASALSSRSPRLSADFEPEELVAESDEIARHEPMGAPQAQKGAVGAAKVLEPTSAVSVRELSVPARHELVVREDDVAALPAQDLVWAGEVEHVAGEAGRRQLPQAAPGGAHGGAEDDHAVLDRGPQDALRVG